ncbi:hypothetical protein [Edwardsiella tarda]|uniref:hypothetical protein n=1 Tax=Edwardsiella tarda TaxID=636 RepID=UPI00351C8362
MNKLLISSVTALLCSNALAYGEAGQWSSRKTQNGMEYAAVIDEQNKLIISCDNNGKDIAMYATIKGVQVGTGVYDKTFDIQTSKSNYFTPYVINGDSSVLKFYYLWDEIKTEHSITLQPYGLELPTANASQVLPDIGSSEFICLTKWTKKKDYQAPAQVTHTKVGNEHRYSIVADDKHALYFACDNTNKITMRAILDGNEYDAEKGAFYVSVGERAEPASVATNNKAYLDKLWDGLRENKTLYLISQPENITYVLTPQGGASALPDRTSSDFTCLTADTIAHKKNDALLAQQGPTTASTFSVNVRPIIPNKGLPSKVITVVSHSDRVKITKAVVNRGQCRVKSIYPLPQTLAFGNELMLYTGYDCNVLELNLSTTNGDVEYQFQPQN